MEYYELQYNGDVCGKVIIFDKCRAVVTSESNTVRFDFKRIFVGDSSIGHDSVLDLPLKCYRGTTCLFYIDKVSADDKTNYTYYYANNSLKKFNTTEEIKYYIGDMRNWYVPYTYAIGDEFVYLLNDDPCVVKVADILTLTPTKSLSPIFRLNGSEYEPNDICLNIYPAIDIMMRNPYDAIYNHDIQKNKLIMNKVR